MTRTSESGGCAGRMLRYEHPQTPLTTEARKERATVHFTDCCTAGTPKFPEKGSLEEMGQTSLAEGCNQVMGPCDKIPIRLER